MSDLGRVVLVGAGPGDPDLITVRGAKALAGADVVLFDQLATNDLLDLAPARAERAALSTLCRRDLPWALL